MDTNIADLRRNYSLASLEIGDTASSPFAQFGKWFDEALQSQILEPNAMTLCTADAEGFPDGRIVLLKGFDEQGFVFYTNFESKKGQQMSQNSRAALVFFWGELERQVRIRGNVEKVLQEEAEEYFRSRPRESRLGAWSSEQSTAIDSRDIISERFAKYAAEFAEGEVPLPDFWGGYRVVPSSIEFWQGRESRLHDRILYSFHAGEWKKSRLSP